MSGGVGVADKVRFWYDSTTSEWGLQVRLTNKTGANSVKGEIVTPSSGTDMAFDKEAADGLEPIGIVYEAGVVDGSECWIWVNGSVCQVLLKDSTSATRGYWVGTSDTAGRADATNSSAPGLILTHFQEIGHCLETKTGGTNVLARIMLHFN
jgi:hypothetical protein